jgi:hypothetical protein
MRQQDLRVFGKILTPALMKEAASNRCEAGKQPLEPCQPGLVGDRRRTPHRQEFHQHPGFDLQ